MLGKKLKEIISRCTQAKIKKVQKEDGIAVILQKLKCLIKLLFIIFFSIILLPIIICIRLLQPFVLIRFGSLVSTRIGHFAAETELYLCERDVGLHPKNAMDIFFCDRIVCNYQLKKMWDRILRVCPITKLQRPLFIANRWIPGGEKHIVSFSPYKDIHGFYEQTHVHLSFNSEEEVKGYKDLHKLGIPESAKIVCFIARDQSYVQAKYSEGDWYYQNYRNSNIDNYVCVAEELVKRGYYLVRMGEIAEKPLKTDNPSIIDYVTRFRTEFLDIFLGAKCEFFICSASGIFAVPAVFRKPIVFVNYVPVEYVESWCKDSITIFKKLWLKKERRFMTFHEMLKSGAGRFFRTEEFELRDIELIENTPAEIRDVAIEMDERLKGTWQTTEEDEKLQQRFWSLFKKSEFHGVIRARIGRDFLRQNRDLLE